MEQQTSLKLIISVRYLFDHHLWDRVCDALGWDVWAVNEGRMQMDDLVTIDVMDHSDLCDAICAAYTEVENETDRDATEQQNSTTSV